MCKTDEMIKQIADAFIAKIEAFNGKWEEPFFGANKNFARNVITKRQYRGLNLVCLWLSQEKNNFTSNLWGTFDQWKEKGKSIRKDEKGTCIFFFKPMKYTVEIVNEAGESEIEEKETYIIRYYTVFNACQMTDYVPEETEQTAPDVLEEIADFKTKFLDKTGIKYSEGHGRACYRPATDEVLLPSIEQFLINSEYIPPACHEFTHATGAEHRLNRDFSGKFGDEAYAFEELIADIGAGFVSAALGKSYIFQNNNIAYLKSWAKVLKDQPRAILKACSHAQKAADYLLDLAEIGENALDNINF